MLQEIRIYLYSNVCSKCDNLVSPLQTVGDEAPNMYQGAKENVGNIAEQTEETLGAARENAQHVS